MKKVISIALVTMLWLSVYAAAPLSIDTAHSNIGFSVPIAGGLAQVSGKFGQFSVNLNFDETDITKSTVEVTIKADSINTGIERRDAHLKNPDFFEVEKFPEITFKSKKVEKSGDGYVLTGDFSMHGVTKEISFPFTIDGNCYNQADKTVTPPCGFNANLKLDRRDYGVSYARGNDPNFIGHIIDVNLNLLAVTPRPRQ